MQTDLLFFQCCGFRGLISELDEDCEQIPQHIIPQGTGKSIGIKKCCPPLVFKTLRSPFIRLYSTIEFDVSSGTTGKQMCDCFLCDQAKYLGTD